MVRSGAVVAARCSSYELEAVQAALREVLAPLGGMEAFVRPGERIALKPNLLFGTPPEQAIITHPVVTAAVALAVKEAGAHPVVIESPGSGIVHVKSMIERIYRKTGYRELADRYDFELSLDTEWQSVSLPEGRTIHRMEVISPLLRVDGLINLAKFKTHTFMVFTGATKNLFGVIPGLNKVGYHGRFTERERFAGMLLDVAGFVKPRLNLVDGILALEGQGPGTGGTPRHLGVLLAGTDPVAVDVACCRIAGIDTAAVPVLAVAAERGLWSGRAAEVDTMGTRIAELQVKDFRFPLKNVGSLGVSGSLEKVGRSLLRGGFTPRPRPQKGPCTICGSCEQACPVQAISLDKKARVAKVDDDKCIRCYCCHEVCPYAAIELEFTGLGRAMHALRLV